MTTILSALLIATAVGIVCYWVDFYIRGEVHVIKEDWYIEFQRAFVPADLWTSACAMIGGVGLLAGQTYGLVFALIAAASLIFLALMDIAFNIENDLYRLIFSSSQMKFEVLINLSTLGLVVGVIVYLSGKVAFV